AETARDHPRTTVAGPARPGEPSPGAARHWLAVPGDAVAVHWAAGATPATAATRPLPRPPAGGRYGWGRRCRRAGRCDGSSAAYVAVAEHHVFLAGQAVQADRAARMQLVGGDTDFCAQAIFKAIGKACRGIDHHRTGINFGKEAPRITEVLGDDRIGMLRA